jgi:hypothetical protein
MSIGLDTQPSATTYDLEDLVELAWQGRVRVPHFQRDFRWGRQDVARLFDSVVRGYPIGSLLLWVRRAPAQELTLGTLVIDAPATDSAYWVVDGQQRITSLANALHPDGSKSPQFALAYDLRVGAFVPGAGQEDPWQVPLPVIFDLQGVLRWFSQRPEIADHLEQATAVTKRLRQFKVPAYLVRQEDEAILRDIFDRMNNYGKRLSRAEIFSALFAGSEAESVERLNTGLIADHINANFGFGVIDDDTVVSAILARRGPDPAREIRSEFSDEVRRGPIEFPGENRDAAYEAGEEAMRKAVDFLQNVAGVPHFTFLAYRYLLVVLCRFYAHFPSPEPRNVQLLRRWYWRTAVVGPEIFKGSFTNAMRVLCSKVRPGDESGSVQRLLEPVDRLDQPLPNIRRFRTNEAVGKIALCALWSLQPRSPITGEPYERTQLSDILTDRPTAADAVAHIINRNAVPAPYRLWAANRMFIASEADSPDEARQRIAHQPHDVPFDDWLHILRSHGLSPGSASLLASDDTVTFLTARQDELNDVLQRFMHRMAEWGFEDTPPLSDMILDEEDQT